MTTKEKTLYDAAIEVSNEFLGPAGERFMRRQISTHLDIEPEKLRRQDFEELVKWVRLTFAVLTDDQKSVNDFASRLRSLVQGTKNTRLDRQSGENGRRSR